MFMNNCRFVILLFVALFIGACKNGTSKEASSCVENDSVSAPSANPHTLPKVLKVITLPRELVITL